MRKWPPHDRSPAQRPEGGFAAGHSSGRGARAAALFWRFQWIVSVDGTTYIRLARYFLGGPFIDTQQPPGYPFLISLPLRAVGGDGVSRHDWSTWSADWHS